MSTAGQILIIHVKYITKKIYRAVPSNKKSFVLNLKNKNSIDLPIYAYARSRTDLPRPVHRLCEGDLLAPGEADVKTYAYLLIQHYIETPPGA